MGRVCAYYVIFQFPHAYTRLFCPTNYKKLQNIFNVVTKQRQNWNTERIMQFFKIATYVQIDRPYGLVHYAACVFCSYINCLRLALVGVAIRLFMQSWLVWALSSWERERVWRSCVFVGVDVKYIIHYRRICKFICSLWLYGRLSVQAYVYMYSSLAQQLICRLIGGICVVIRRELNLFVNCFCDCMCICMWYCLCLCECYCICIWIWIWKMLMYMIYPRS